MTTSDDAVPPALQRAIDAFIDAHRSQPKFVARAPGRVNLMGEHTDYNDGFVLPIALPFDTVIAGTPTPDRSVDVVSAGFGHATFSLDDEPRATIEWARYIHGMGHVLAESGHPTRGFVGVVATDIPAGASLSSSAALEIAAGLALSHHGEEPIDPTVMANLGQRVENEIFGLPSGIMDQLASATSTEGCASLIDCRSLLVTPTALPHGTTVVVMDTGTRRQLVESDYADRQATCARVARQLGVAALCDATLDDLQRLDPGDTVGRRRATHVITENQRTLDAADSMRSGDTARLGALMRASHASLRDDYEVSGPALDLIVAIASETHGCIGARMTGGGFAGGAVAIVETKHVDAFCETVLATYAAPASQPPAAPAKLWPVLPAAGASIEFA